MKEPSTEAVVVALDVILNRLTAEQAAKRITDFAEKRVAEFALELMRTAATTRESDKPWSRVWPVICETARGAK